ncbi:hypothetical protein E4O03_10250 [Treponema sp. OMZ 792]|uniref:hypothetical protein n=1 Tax=unclassified Treponema TaxID=2638727 RepID=UPI0020A6155C|nr:MULTISPECIES: hypothetical protein [unclassified Treponema]UTC74583.1 hypothetical protein E4O03_10250 [Treponema sp. OMZ 792]UTC80979.1 hypothetical protein E4O07_10160 [Treponema sp. OMZ 798]
MKKVKAIIFNSMHSVGVLIGSIFFLIGIIEILIGALIPAARNVIFFQGLMFLFVGTMIPSLPFYESITMYILMPIHGKEYFIANSIYSLSVNFLSVFILSLILYIINFFLPIEDFKLLILIMFIYLPAAISFNMILCAVAIKGGLLRSIITSVIAYGLPPTVLTLVTIGLNTSHDKLKSFFEIIPFTLFFLAVYLVSLVLILISFFLGTRNFNEFRIKGFMLRNKNR